MLLRNIQKPRIVHGTQDSGADISILMFSVPDFAKCKKLRYSTTNNVQHKPRLKYQSIDAVSRGKHENNVTEHFLIRYKPCYNLLQIVTNLLQICNTFCNIEFWEGGTDRMNKMLLVCYQAASLKSKNCGLE